MVSRGLRAVVICFPLRFHLMYKPPPTVEVQVRLLQNPKDSEEYIKLQTDLFYRNSGDLEQYYDRAIIVNGDQDPYTVFEYIESGIIFRFTWWVLDSSNQNFRGIYCSN